MKKYVQQMLVMLVFLLVTLTPVGYVPKPVHAQDPAGELFRLINNFRAELGLAPFTYNQTLAAAAQQQANFITSTNQYTHTGANGSSPQDRATGLGYSGFVVENIVGGWKMTPNQALTWWINSPVHYRTLVSTRHTQAGVGYAFGNDQHRFTLVVGRPGQVSQAAPAEPQPEPLVIDPVVLAEPAPDGSITHVVGQGQALWSLAAHYEVSLADLLLFNNLAEDAFLQPGDEVIIRLAEGQSPPPTPTPPSYHVVREGQTLWTIAATYNIKLSELLWLNSLPEDAFIQPGQEITVRLEPGQQPPPTPTPQMTYIVQEGDALWPIAASFGLTLDQLLALNGISADALLQPGQELVIREPQPTVFPPTFTPRPTATISMNLERDSPTPTPLPQAASASGLEAERAVEEPLAVSSGQSDPPETGSTESRSGINWGIILGGAAAALGGAGLILVWAAGRRS